MEKKVPSIEQNPFSVLKLSVTRLMHIREVQATGGGHFAKVARELGYEDGLQEREEERWASAELAQADQLRKRRANALADRLRAARERLGVSSLPPPFDPREDNQVISLKTRR